MHDSSGVMEAWRSDRVGRSRCARLWASNGTELNTCGTKAFAHGTGDGGGSSRIRVNTKSFSGDGEFHSRGGNDDTAGHDAFGLSGSRSRSLEEGVREFAAAKRTIRLV